MNLSYGIRNEGTLSLTQPLDLAASCVFKNKGGKFMTKDGSGNYAISVATDTQIAGWAMYSGDFTSSSTATADKVVICDDLDAIFEMPTDAAFTAAELKALIGKTCDLVVNSSVQQADIGASSTDVVKIVGGDVTAQTVFVKLNPAKLYTAGVA